ncbi:ornithine cyclodeaminase family protein [Salinibacillus xinjiangensis]|uniref:Ornithine cyclodeaminase family protein n=1 Tax=Salinibacillus xinjiangensis TaxID=1229268 RepID=A0A6G1X1J9_9BACI|nr:ornithine cyclodeaminase family protein [Salinibacillus xinjiangensis]MRG84770.1 ornithine cyclodeaminase family protein [Salinibacillus xinjiangensis]
MLILSEKEIQQHYKMKDAIADVKKGLISKQDGSITSPHRTVLDIPKYEGSALYMPSADLAQEMAAVKVVSIFPQNPKQGKPTTQGVLMLTDATTGEHVCMMNASYLTRLRTGALSGIATEKLARPNASVLGVIGTGGMAFEQVLGMLEVRWIESIKLFNRTLEKAEQFKGRLKDFGVTQSIEVVESSEEVVPGADIICCATRSKEPVFDGELVKPGTHINGVGSFLPSMREVDQTTIERAAKIVVDDLSGVKDEAGELIHADQETDWSFSDVYAELSEIGGYDLMLRDSDEEITFFKSVGAAYFDLVVAIGVYQKLKDSGVGVSAEL